MSAKKTSADAVDTVGERCPPLLQPHAVLAERSTHACERLANISNKGEGRDIGAKVHPILNMYLI